MRLMLLAAWPRLMFFRWAFVLLLGGCSFAHDRAVLDMTAWCNCNDAVMVCSLDGNKTVTEGRLAPGKADQGQP